MSKNLTRKGLAFGALVALGSSVLAGAPAFAADSIVLAPNYSSDATLATLNGETLTLNASLAPGSVAANITQLKYKVVNNGAKDLTAVNQAATSTGAITAAAGSAYLAGAGSATAANTVALSVASISTDATQTATVTAFLDSNNNGLVDSAETQTSVTVSFLKWSEATTTTTVSAATAGDTAVTAVVKFTNVNNQSIAAGKIGAYFTKGDGTTLTPADAAVSTTVAQGNGTVVTYTQAAHGYAVGDIVTVAGANTAGYNGTFQVATVPTANTFTVASTENSATVTGTITAQRNGVVKTGIAYSATAGGFKYVTNAVAALVKGSAVKVQPLYNSTAVLTNTSNSIGSAQTASVISRTVSSLTADFVKSTTAAAANAASTTEAEAVSLNASKSVAFKVLDSATTPAAFAGQTVSVAVSTAQTLSSSKTITINGTVYSSNAALPGATGVAKLAVVTGADGKAVVSYTTAGFATTNTVVLTATIENFSATATGTETARTYSQYIENHEGANAVTTDGAAVKINVVVQDQFGGAPADGTFTMTATLGSSGQTTAATSASNTFAAVVAGKATLTVLDNGTGLGNNVYAISRWDTAANGVLTSENTSLGNFTIKIVAATDVAAGNVTLTATAGGTELGTNSAASAYVITAGTRGASDTLGALTYSDFSSVDLRTISGTAPSTLAADGTTSTATTGKVVVYGTVNSASTSTYAGVPVPGQVVTVTGTNKLFYVTQDSADIWGADTLSFVTDNNGRFALNVYSQLAGKQTVTIKSGTGTATIELYFAEAAVAATKTVAVTVADGAAQFQAGRALDVTVKVTDKFGNPIATTQADVANDGHLTLSQTGSGYLANSGRVNTSAAGTYTTKLITNAGDLGTSTIVATVDLATDVTKSVASEFGVTDADVTVGGRAVYASVEFAKGKTVTVSVDGKRLYSKLFSTDAYTELKFTQKTAGKHTVTVRISGGIVYSEVVTTTK